LANVKLQLNIGLAEYMYALTDDSVKLNVGVVPLQVRLPLFVRFPYTFMVVIPLILSAVLFTLTKCKQFLVLLPSAGVAAASKAASSAELGTPLGLQLVLVPHAAPAPPIHRLYVIVKIQSF
jgi:hypothetical protein